MMIKKNSIELLSPAGNFDCLQAAINGGADAIYFGVEQLNMRAGSVNSFSIADIKQIAAICRKNHIHCYITLNTILYDHDMQLLRSILKEVKKQKVDAVIAADFAVIENCHQLGIPVHISTQANISNIETVKFYARLTDVVVLARELTLKQIENISKEIQRKKIKGISGELIKIEAFIHGALCMAISGKCYLSLHTQNASANRGACKQNCRHAYTVTDAETGDELLIDNEYIMSPKDLCTINILDKIVGSGVRVLKIEGRSKGPDYVYTVTKCYREAMEAIGNKTYDAEHIQNWIQRLQTVYNRGFWEGYFMGQQLGQWTKDPGSIATEKKVYIGKGSKYYPKIKVGEFLVESGSLKKGDTIMVTGFAVGMAKEKMETLTVNGVQSDIAVKGDKVTFPFAVKVSPKDKLYKIVGV